MTYLFISDRTSIPTKQRFDVINFSTLDVFPVHLHLSNLKSSSLSICLVFSLTSSFYFSHSEIPLVSYFSRNRNPNHTQRISGQDSRFLYELPRRNKTCNFCVQFAPVLHWAHILGHSSI